MYAGKPRAAAIKEKRDVAIYCGLNWVSPEHVPKSKLQVFMNMTLFGNRVSSDAIKEDEVMQD